MAGINTADWPRRRRRLPDSRRLTRPAALLLPLQPYHLKTFFSNKYAYAQIVRMADGHIVAAASTVEPQTKEALAAAGTSPSCAQAASR